MIWNMYQSHPITLLLRGSKQGHTQNYTQTIHASPQPIGQSPPSQSVRVLVLQLHDIGHQPTQLSSHAFSLGIQSYLLKFGTTGPEHGTHLSPTEPQRVRLDPYRVYFHPTVLTTSTAPNLPTVRPASPRIAPPANR